MADEAHGALTRDCEVMAQPMERNSTWHETTCSPRAREGE